ncbi:MAG TPA: MFS transporter [Thermoanaerobaculaceae bacterium]|nr:MFS transporter [Thermoanaerobaculaceae bacterium]
MSGPSLGHAWRALRHRNFRLYFAGQGISIIGTWMTRMATVWLVYRLTHSPLLLGVVGFAGLIPTFVLAPFAGVWIERLDHRRLLVWTQAAAGTQSLILAALTLARVVTFREILILAVFQGLINAFDTPLRQIFVGQMVDDREDLGNAIAISSSLSNGARLIGPAIAGLVIAGFGEGGCFLIDGLSYLAVIASLLMMRIRPLATRPNRAGMLEQMREGWKYVSGFRPVRALLLLVALLALMGYPYNVLLPVFAGQVLHGGPTTLGWLTAASGVGALGSGLSLAFRRSTEGLTRMLQIAAAALGGGLILFGLSRTLWLSMGLMVLIGFGMMQVFSASNTLIQTLVPEDKRGRVMSYFVMAMFGAAPFGSLLAGALAHRIGAPNTVFVTGAFCLAGSLWFGLERPGIQAVIQAIA